VFSTGVTLWLVYGVPSADAPLLVANGVTMVLVVPVRPEMLTTRDPQLATASSGRMTDNDPARMRLRSR
jgi:hypothetical protein